MDIKIAHTLALSAKNAYNNEDVAESIAAEWGFNDFTWFDACDTQAYVMADDTRCVVAFRGTEAFQDWLTDLDIFKIAGPYGKVHRGFNEALDYVWQDVENAVAAHSDKRVYLTGHSLGAALATLATARFNEGYPLYTFGSPRVGDAKFAKEFNLRNLCHRFVNNNDIVARIPIAGYEHVGSLWHFTVQGKMWAEPCIWWITYDRLVGRFRRIAADGALDHDKNMYVDLVAGQMSYDAKT